jgi:serine/threonine protein kinase
MFTADAGDSVEGRQAGDPERIGRYRIVGRLGSGGMGRVFLGRSGGGRLLAIKVIRAELAEDPSFRVRFSREVDAAKKVSGLFTAPVVDADVDAPMPWLATAYVPGPSLAEAITSDGPLPASALLALAAGLAEGLSAIHAAGLVHRDLKPSNVLLADDGPRVIDFGISRAAEASALTGTGLVVGSPGFMSPEQAEGHEVGPPSDVFSLGGVLTFAGTGQGPFGTGPTAALLYRIVHNPPTTEGLPEQVRLLAERCLRKAPRERPTSAQILAELEDVQPVEGWLPQSVVERLRPRQPSGPGNGPGNTATGRQSGPSVPLAPEPQQLAPAVPSSVSRDPATLTTASANAPDRGAPQTRIPAQKAHRLRKPIFAAAALLLLVALGCVAALTLPGKSVGSRQPAAASSQPAGTSTSQQAATRAQVNPCQDNPLNSAVVGSACLALPAGYWQQIREPDYLTASECLDACGADLYAVRFIVLTATAYDDAFKGQNVGDSSQELGVPFSKPLNINSFQSLIGPLGISCTGGHLEESGTQPFGPKTADYREWSFNCPNNPPQRELQVWDVPGSKIVVISYQNAQSGSTPVQAMVTNASFIKETAPALPTPVQLSPRNGSVYSEKEFPRPTTISWKAVPGATKYLVQTQACDYYGCSAQPSGENGNIFPYSVIVAGTSYSFDFVGSQPGRWRVTALRSDGALSQFSSWWGFTYAGS